MYKVGKNEALATLQARERGGSRFRLGKSSALTTLRSRMENDPKIIQGAKVATSGEFTRNELFALRTELTRRLLDGRRNLDEECGYPDTGRMDCNLFRALYDREGIAAKVVSIYPEACWELSPEVYEVEDMAKLTPFEEAWGKLLLKSNIWHYLQRIDELSGIGRFGVLLFGIDDGRGLNQPVEGVRKDGTFAESPDPRKLIYLRTFDETLCRINSFEDDERSPRFGQPKMYEIDFHDPRQPFRKGSYSASKISRQVHWSRVIHIADNCKTSEVFGMSRLQQTFNRLYDLRKLLGGSAEMFWKGAFPGFSFEVDPSLRGQTVTMDSEKLKEEFRKYADGLQRYISTIGLQIKSLAPQVANPAPHIRVQIEALCIALGCPIQVFMGSDKVINTSSQYVIQWHRRVRHRQINYVSPKIIRPFVDRMMDVGVLPRSDEYQVDHPDLSTPDDETKAKASFINTQALGQYVETGACTIMGPKDYLIRVQNYTVGEAEAILQPLGGDKKAQKLLMEAFKNQTAKPVAKPMTGGGKKAVASKSSVKKGQKRPKGASK